MVSLFRLATSFVHCIQSARDFDGLLNDLGVVAQTGRGTHRGIGCVITFHSGVVGRGSSQRVSLPLMVDSSGFRLADRRHDGGVGGGDVINNIAQVFTLTNSGIGLIGCHFCSLQKAFKCVCSITHISCTFQLRHGFFTLLRIHITTLRYT